MTRAILRPRAVVQWVGLAGGPVLGGVCYLLLPEQYRDVASDQIVAFSREGRVTLAVMAWMAVWWLTEAIDISATALLPIPLLPLLGAASVGEATAPYAHPLIFLFLGGFLVALSMQRWGLDRRIALITLRLVGDRPTNMVAGFMLATAVLSMFVSNTATTAMMLPIALSVIVLLGRGTGESDAPGSSNFALCMMLGIAYAASIGGIGTKIGTPPNGFVLGFVEDNYGHEIDFATWLTVGLPLVVVFLPITWLLLTRFVYPVPPARIEGARALVHGAYEGLGAVKPGEWVTLIVFAATALAWITRPILARWVPGLNDSVIVMVAAVLLFMIPVSARRREFTMNWQTAQKAPWGILILFGGGLSLAAAVRRNGVAELIGNQVSALGDVPPIVLVLAVTALVIFLTELTSNTATTATLVPILAALAPGLGVHPYLLIFPAAIAASCAFMMPVATPPNAIVFGSGYMTIPQMCKAGLWLNLIGIGLITALAGWVIMPLLGGDTSAAPG
ncbi:MAG: SLC13 family permease [Planctomycetota bacterium]|jgi:sodium-dependent dicarboxylate transporter 2/3/5